jgi:hypothetical protein
LSWTADGADDVLGAFETESDTRPSPGVPLLELGRGLSATLGAAGAAWSTIVVAFFAAFFFFLRNSSSWFRKQDSISFYGQPLLRIMLN